MLDGGEPAGEGGDRLLGLQPGMGRLSGPQRHHRLGQPLHRRGAGPGRIRPRGPGHSLRRGGGGPRNGPVPASPEGQAQGGRGKAETPQEPSQGEPAGDPGSGQGQGRQGQAEKGGESGVF